MSAVMLKLGGFAGQDVDRTIIDACGVARRVGCWVKINVNGIDVLIAPTDEEKWLLRNYHIARERGADFVSSNIIPDPRALTGEPT